MHFAIGTTNIPKTQAVEQLISTSPYTLGATFSNYKIPSWVSDMPKTLTEIREWARNRARNTKAQCLLADYYVGMEWWVYKDSVWGEYWLLGIAYIEDRDGVGYYGYSCHLAVPKAVVEWLFDGNNKELEEVVYHLGWWKNIWDSHGSFFEWTDGMLTRKEQFLMALQCAIAPHFNTYYSLSK